MAEAALAVAGSVVKGVAGYEAGAYNRAASRNEARNAMMEGAAQEARIREAARMAMGEQVAAQGSNGFQIGSGSALDALQQSAINATMDALEARRQAASKARSLRASGNVAYAEGTNSLVQNLIGAGSKAASADWGSPSSSSAGGG